MVDEIIEPIKWDRARIDSVQEERLLATIEHAYANSAVTRDAWDAMGVKPSDISSRADFQARVPFLTADDIRDVRRAEDDPFMGMRCIPVHEITAIGTTSGTTGLPQPLPQTRGDIREQSSARDRANNGVGPASRILSVGSPTRSGHGGARRGAPSHGFSIFVDAEPATVSHLVHMAREFRPTHWWILNGPLLMALRQYESETGDDLVEAFSSIGPTVWGGEPLGAASKAIIEGWGLDLRIMTSLGNACAAVDCPAQDGSHAWEDLVFVECLDPVTHEPVPDGGRGELVVTTVADRSAPLIRYRSGDLVRWTTQQCGCGTHHGRLWTIGRLVDSVTVGGRSILPADVWPTIESLPETESALFQIVRSKSTEESLWIRVGYEDTTPESRLAGIEGHLRAALEEAVGVKCDVELLSNTALMSTRAALKLPRVVAN